MSIKDLSGHSLLNRYFLREHVGSGGMADVYLAWDTMRSAKMAVKVLRRDLAMNPKFFRMFTNEAEFLRKLEHPNIVRLFDFERERDLVFIIMDWVEGEDLSGRIADRKTPFDLLEVSRILQPVCAALYYAHQNSVYHCDVKPANILLHQDGKVLLTDFGVAHLATETADGGTAPYMAPEQFRGGNVSAQTDIYALGITIYEMLSGGCLPYRGETSKSQGSTLKERIAWEHLNLDVPSLKKQNPQIPQAVEQVVTTALSKDARDRFQSTMALREAFEHARLAGDHSGDMVSTILRPATGNHKKSKKPDSSPPAQKRARQKKPSKQHNSGPQLYCRSGEMARKVIPILSQGLRIGRRSTNQLQLKERSVSRNHAVIWITPQGTYIRDEKSSLGTYVNGQKITQPVLLRPGDVIQIGYHQVFEYRE